MHLGCITRKKICTFELLFLLGVPNFETFTFTEINTKSSLFPIQSKTSQTLRLSINGLQEGLKNQLLDLEQRIGSLGLSVTKGHRRRWW